ncbi:Cys-tRNA(Pro) deacylase [Actinoallomurus sp. NBC_01490]|uniref:Cys-tRNA(Pro) deacylase n=1 Tax=Actinoallomurus sp. NBC_01490 TaxID=2903557 RepID=UPI002E34E8A6|nr:Cys-tRNA(Pro) deacylase [Actinoallomurus sp. NBC_01490]
MGSKKNGGKGTPATVVATRAGVAFTLHPYETGGGEESYGEAAADALGVPRDRLFKTLVTEVDGDLTVAVVPVSATLDLKALAGAAGGKRAAMADPAAAERVTGYVRGGISPLGQRKRLPTVVDSSASGFSTIYVSAGRRGLQIELAPADLVTLTGATTAGIARRRA